MTTMPEPPFPTINKSPVSRLYVPVAIGTLVAVALGVYGGLHEPSGGVFTTIAGFSAGIYAKAWLATGAAILAIVQLISAMIMYGKIKVTAPTWIGGLHRWSGRIAVLLTVPVAVHCLYALGFDTFNTRTLIHSLLGCLFYGAFVAKMLVLTRKGTPGWSLPVLGGIVFTALIALWLTSSVWLFSTKGLHF